MCRGCQRCQSYLIEPDYLIFIEIRFQNDASWRCLSMNFLSNIFLVIFIKNDHFLGDGFTLQNKVSGKLAQLNKLVSQSIAKCNTLQISDVLQTFNL